MARRDIVQIDEELCNGCGLCISSCAEGAIQLIDGKARLVKDEYCDGLGACLGECPQGAITIIQRDAEAFDEHAVEEHLQRLAPKPQAAPPPAPAVAHSGGCPGSMMRQFAAAAPAPAQHAPGKGESMPSALQQWPVQLHLVSPTAPYFRNADLLLSADCAAFALGGFHGELLANHALAIACPKLDNAQGYVEKLAAMITDGGIRSITIAMMQVPCCRGLDQFVAMAKELAGIDIPVYRVIVGIEGGLLLDERPKAA